MTQVTDCCVARLRNTVNATQNTPCQSRDLSSVYNNCTGGHNETDVLRTEDLLSPWNVSRTYMAPTAKLNEPSVSSTQYRHFSSSPVTPEIYWFILLYMKPTQLNIHYTQWNIRMVQRMQLAHQQLQGRATDAARLHDWSQYWYRPMTGSTIITRAQISGFFSVCLSVRRRDVTIACSLRRTWLWSCFCRHIRYSTLDLSGLLVTDGSVRIGV